MKKIYLIFCFVVIISISFLGITYSYEYNNSENLKFELLGDYIINLSLGDNYVESGVFVTYGGKDISSEVIVDSSLDIFKVGEYKIKYIVNIDGNYEYIYRIVRVRESIKPEIILKGNNVVYVNLNGTYREPGYVVRDNYDKNLYDKVVVSSNIDVTKIGEYEVTYYVSDSSGNEANVSRTVIVR